MTANTETNHCPHCGADVTKEPETECGLICPKCHDDFWRSETIPGADISQYTHFPEYNLMIRTKE